MRLNAGTLTALPATVRRPFYDRNRTRIGLAHLGAGAFHRCHQAEFTDDVLESGADDRALLCINIKPPSLQDQIGAQDCYYTRTLRDDDANETRLIGAIRRCIDADGNTEAAIAALVTPEIETLTLTVTEKGYCHIPATGALDESHADIVADLKPGAMPRSVPGFIVAALEARRKAGLGGLNLVSCDNIPSNGKVLEACVLGFAAPRSKELSAWIQDSARFPSTMVDRIVPATTLEDIENLAKAIGVEDRGAVFGEPFRQWVLEDSFIGRRPRWEAAGAELVGDVKPFELIKMRVLNAAQTVMALLGSLAGHRYTFEVERDPMIRAFVERMLIEETLPGLPRVSGMDGRAYIRKTFKRLHNRSIRHLTRQIATDTSRKIRQRLLDPIRDNIAAGRPIDGLCVSVAAWLAYLASSGARWPLSDPIAGDVERILAECGRDTTKIVDRLLAIASVFGTDLPSHPKFRTMASDHVQALLSRPTSQVISEFLDGGGATSEPA